MGQDLNQALVLRMQEQFLEELRGVNAVSARFGLRLSEQGMRELAQARTHALTDHGRVELGASAVKNIVDGFCDSPYLLQEDYEATLLELVDAFYYFKNETEDTVSDDDLLTCMKKLFDGKCRGSVDLLQSLYLEELARHIRSDGANEGDIDEK